MIILIHGTGDDDTKDENWMKWVGALMRSKGEQVLVLPGVGSGQQGELHDRALGFLQGLVDGGELPYLRHPEVDTVPEGLRASLAAAGASEANELRPLLTASKNVRTQRHFQILMSLVAEAQRAEDGLNAVGIKTRAAFAALCAKAYYQSCPPDLLQPIRIIGHSRGGSAAIATHNVLRWYGIRSVETLTLDPCHGVKKIGAKDYTHTVWSGSVVNMPVVKEVGTGSTWLHYTLRPDISAGEGSDEGTRVDNRARLTTIEHGHMGKLKNFKKPGKVDYLMMRADAMLAEKAAGQAALKARLNGIIGGDAMELEDIFDQAEDKKGDLADKKLIHTEVCKLLGSRDWPKVRRRAA